MITEKPRVVLQEGELRVKVTGAASGPQEIAFPANGSVKTLHEKVTSIVGAECLQKLLLGGSLLSEQAAGSAEKNNEEKTLESIGATPGSTVFAICTTKEEIKEIEDQDSGLTKFDGRRTFEQEAELERRRERAKPMYARKAEGSLQDYSFGFANITPLQADPNTGRKYTTPPPADALKLLEKLANDPGIQAVMKKYQWRVGLLTEIAPSLDTGLMGVSDHCLLGLNVNKGQEIQLRLRTSDLLGFRPYLSIKETLIHELTHMVHGDHDAQFWSLFRVLMREADEMDWTKSSGHAVADGRSHLSGSEDPEPVSTGHTLGSAVEEATPWADAAGRAADRKSVV